MSPSQNSSPEIDLVETGLVGVLGLGMLTCSSSTSGVFVGIVVELVGNGSGGGGRAALCCT